jgi:hypothetical protein
MEDVADGADIRDAFEPHRAVEGAVGDVVLDQAVCRKLRLDSVLQVVDGLVVQDLEVVDKLHLDPVPRKSFDGDPLNDGTLDDAITGAAAFGLDEDPVIIPDARSKDHLVVSLGPADQVNVVLLDADCHRVPVGLDVGPRHEDDPGPRCGGVHRRLDRISRVEDGLCGASGCRYAEECQADGEGAESGETEEPVQLEIPTDA